MKTIIEEKDLNKTVEVFDDSEKLIFSKKIYDRYAIQSISEIFFHKVSTSIIDNWHIIDVYKENTSDSKDVMIAEIKIDKKYLSTFNYWVCL